MMFSFMILPFSGRAANDTFFQLKGVRGVSGGPRRMRIGVISRKQTFWSTRRILRAIKDRGHEPAYAKTDEIRLVVGDPPDALIDGRSVREGIVYIPRVGRSMTDFGGMRPRQLELMGVPATLSDQALITVRNRFLALQALHEAGVPVPRTVLLASRPNVMEARTFVPHPAVLKILRGTQGMG